MQYRVIKNHLYCAGSSNFGRVSCFYLKCGGYRDRMIGYCLIYTGYHQAATGYSL